MDERPKGDRPVKEPIKKPWIWILMAVIMLAAIPWYLPGGAITPIILGMPYWAFISLVFSLVLCAYLSWLCLFEWDVVEEEEKRAKSRESRGE